MVYRKHVPSTYIINKDCETEDVHDDLVEKDVQINGYTYDLEFSDKMSVLIF